MLKKVKTNLKEEREKEKRKNDSRMKQDIQIIAEIYDLKRRYKENPEIVKAGEARKYQRKLLNIETNESDELYNELHQIFNQIRERNQQRTKEKDLIANVEDII